MGLAISHYDELMTNGLPAQIGMLSLIGDYVKWFEAIEMYKGMA